MSSMPAMQAVVEVLESEGVDTIFGIPGAAILPFYDALRQSSMRHLTVRHEEGATHAADGYSRATGRIGVAVGTSGPAGTNMVTGLYTAWADSVPILTITGQVPVAQLDREGFVDEAVTVLRQADRDAWRNAVRHVAMRPVSPRPLEASVLGYGGRPYDRPPSPSVVPSRSVFTQIPPVISASWRTEWNCGTGIRSRRSGSGKC